MSQNNLKITSRDAAIVGGLTIACGVGALVAGKGVGIGLGYGWSATKWGFSKGWDATKYIGGNGLYYAKETPFAIGRSIKWTVSTAWGATKWTVGTAWDAGKGTVKFAWTATKWTVGNGLSIAKYILFNIPSMIKWCALTGWGIAKWCVKAPFRLAYWCFSIVRHPIDSIVSTYNRCVRIATWGWNFTSRNAESAWYVFDKYVLDNVEKFSTISFYATEKMVTIAWDSVQIGSKEFAEAFPRLGHLGGRVKDAAVSVFDFTSPKVLKVKDFVLDYNPMPKVFEKCPSLINPTYAAATAAGINLAVKMQGNYRLSEPRKVYIPEYMGYVERGPRQYKFNDNIERFIFLFISIVIGTALLTPRIANKLSSHSISRLQGTGWGVTFATMTMGFDILSLDQKNTKINHTYYGEVE